MAEHDDDGSPIPRVYTLKEAADALRVPRDWLRTRLANGTYAGLRRGNRWAMTEQQILAAIESMTVPVREPETYPGGITRRSWLAHQRPRSSANRKPLARPAPKVQPAPSWYQMVHAESPEAVASLPELTETQRKLLERLQHEGTVVLGGRDRRTIEALVRRGLATYEAAHVLNEKHLYYAYRFTIHFKGETR
ncbi:hypothetical protein JF729_14620 [Mycobacterium intracellulare]|uniref:hypothetical protein n=1 Tax=Mycobacterium intracellulare TaxID=1767 RepID=UPI001CDA4DA7|nr:hypothetical protein [Mycobacterium intracellulare]MCA2249016.1 hypothetical protein [Mycobacterium intracellulare]